MKKLVLAAIAALSLGIGSAYAHETVFHNNVEYWGPPSANSTEGG